MSYLPAFHLVDGAFVRCRLCAAIIYQSDTATHDAFHEEIDFLEAERKGMAVHLERLDRHVEQLRQMYQFLADLVVPEGMRERLAEPYKPTVEQLAEAREWRHANFPGISDPE